MATSIANMSVECETENGFRKRRVCIIGAGVSGLVATKYLLKLNMDVTVFDLKQGVGGLWRETFGSTILQTPRHEYQFTDFPWPAHVTAKYPTHSEVLDYFESYAMHFGLLDHIHFNTKVVDIRYMGEDRERSLDHAGLWSNNGGPYADGAVWDVGVQKRNEESIEWYRFDFLVLCIGRYGNLPYIPSLPPNKGPEVFQGKVLHTMDYSGLDEKDAYELIKGKRVVVIGLQKSALDFAAECAEANRDGHPCTVVFRRAHWGIITYELFGLPLQLFYNTRFAQFLLERPAQGFLLTVLSRLLRPLRLRSRGETIAPVVARHRLLQATGYLTYQAPPNDTLNISTLAFLWWSKQRGHNRFIILIFLWSIWKWRNDIIFNNIHMPTFTIIDSILSIWHMIYGPP